MSNIDMSNRRHGVAVYQHVAKSDEWCAQCNLPVDICRGHDTNFTTGPADDTAVTAALRAVMALDGMQQAAFAARLSAIDPRFADGMGVLIMDAVGLTMPPPPRRRGPNEEFRRRIAEMAKEVNG